jgi:hypothetical protein
MEGHSYWELTLRPIEAILSDEIGLQITGDAE